MLERWGERHPTLWISWFRIYFRFKYVFSFQDECFKCVSIYFTSRFRIGFPKFWVSNFNFMDFHFMNLRNSKWIPLNFRASNIFFKKLYLQSQFSSTPYFSSTPISHQFLSKRLTISDFKSIPVLVIWDPSLSERHVSILT